MKMIAIASQKGGVGKTTLTLNTAHALARRGWRTLVVDADPQGAIGLSLTRSVTSARGLAELVAGQCAFTDALKPTRLAELTLLPIGQLAVQDTPGFGAALEDGAVFTDIARAARGRFDLVFIDTPSGFQGVTIGALRAATHAITPLQAEPIAFRSLPQLLEVIGALRDDGATVELLGVVLMMLQMRQATSLNVAEELWAQLGDLVFSTTIPRDSAFLDAAGAGVPIGLLGRRPPLVASTFDQLATEIEQRLHLLSAETENAPIPLVD